MTLDTDHDTYPVHCRECETTIEDAAHAERHLEECGPILELSDDS